MLPSQPRTEPSRSYGSRSLSLDFLRAVAVILVMLSHASRSWLSGAGIPDSIAIALHSGGWVGVDLFFVLSGFLIAGLLFREHQRYGKINVGSFLLRRGFKIYPAFYVLLAATVLYHAIVVGGWHRATLIEALFLQSYFGSIWGHTWSLAVEEHFYLLLPLLLFFLCRRQQKGGEPFAALPRICFAICLVALGLRITTSITLPYRPVTHLYPTHLRVDGLMFGVFLAYAYHYHRERFEQVGGKYFWPLIVAGVWAVAPAFLFYLGGTPFLYSLGLTQIFVGCGCILVALVVRPIPSNRLTRTLGYLGAYSYSIYLWHVPMRNWGWKLSNDVLDLSLSERPGIAFLIYIVSSLTAGVLMAKLIEVPVLRLRDRLVPSRSGVPCGSGALHDVTLIPQDLEKPESAATRPEPAAR